MPQAAVVAGIGALGSLGGAAISSRQQSKATNAQLKASDRALAYEREREDYRRQEHSRAMSDYRKQWDAWNQHRLGLMRRYGYKAPTQTASPVMRASSMWGR